MTDEQIAREFLVQALHCQVLSSSIAVLAAIIGEARSTEREACARVADLYTAPAAKYYNTTSIAEIIATAIRSRKDLEPPHTGAVVEEG